MFVFFKYINFLRSCVEKFNGLVIYYMKYEYRWLFKFRFINLVSIVMRVV